MVGWLVRRLSLIRLVLIIIFIKGQFTTEESDHPLSVRSKVKRQTPSCKEQLKANPLANSSAWLVLIQSKFVARVLCEGTLMTPKWVLTVAHCLTGQQDKDLKVVIYSKADSRPVKNSFTYPGYNPYSQQNDIALLVMETSFTISKFVYPVCPKKDKDDIFCKDSCHVSSISQAPAFISMMDIESCKRVYEKSGLRNRVTNSTECATSADDPGNVQCIGSPGTPLTCINQDGQRVLAGLLSLGWSCASPASPAIFTKVSKYYEWIKGNIETQSDHTLEDCSKQFGGNKFIKSYTEDEEGLHIDVFIPNKEIRIATQKTTTTFVPEEYLPTKKTTLYDPNEDVETINPERWGKPEKLISSSFSPNEQSTNNMSGSLKSTEPPKISKISTTTATAIVSANKGLSYLLLKLKPEAEGQKPIYNIVLKPGPPQIIKENEPFILRLKLQRI